MPTPTELELTRKTQVEWLTERGFNPAACGLYRLTNQQLTSLVGSIDRAINMANAIGKAINGAGTPAGARPADWWQRRGF